MTVDAIPECRSTPYPKNTLTFQQSPEFQGVSHPRQSYTRTIPLLLMCYFWSDTNITFGKPVTLIGVLNEFFEKRR
jgi:hypothetical protein